MSEQTLFDALAAVKAWEEALAEFDPDTIRVCAETMVRYPDTPEPIRWARHNFLQRLATALAASGTASGEAKP